MFRIIAIAHAIFAVAHAYEDDHDDHWDDHDDHWEEDHEEGTDFWGALFDHEEVCCSFGSYINSYS